MKFLLDTNLLSELVRPRPDTNVVRWISSVDEDWTFVSVISIAELHHGIMLLDTGRRKAALMEWLHRDLIQRFKSRMLDVTPRIAETWASLKSSARQRGAALGIMDAFIAATAASHDLTLATRNTKDFQMLGLGLVNPWLAVTDAGES